MRSGSYETLGKNPVRLTSGGELAAAGAGADKRAPRVNGCWCCCWAVVLRLAQTEGRAREKEEGACGLGCKRQQARNKEKKKKRKAFLFIKGISNHFSKAFSNKNFRGVLGFWFLTILRVRTHFKSFSKSNFLSLFEY